MRVGIIGAGFVGGHMARALVANGDEVMLGVRNQPSEKVRELLAELDGKATATSVKETVAFAEAVVLALPWNAVEEVMNEVGDWGGKVLLDATNRFGPGTASAGEEVARMAKGARVVKVFNTIGAEHYGNPQFGEHNATMLICGDDADAKSVAAKVASDLGFDVVDAGPLSNAAHLEAMAKLWVYLARNVTGRDIAFKIIKR